MQNHSLVQKQAIPHSAVSTLPFSPLYALPVPVCFYSITCPDLSPPDPPLPVSLDAKKTSSLARPKSLIIISMQPIQRALDTAKGRSVLVDGGDNVKEIGQHAPKRYYFLSPWQVAAVRCAWALAFQLEALLLFPSSPSSILHTRGMSFSIFIYIYLLSRVYSIH